MGDYTLLFQHNQSLIKVVRNVGLQKEHHTKKITQNFHFEKFPFQSICLQTLIVHGDKVI